MALVVVVAVPARKPLEPPLSDLTDPYLFLSLASPLRRFLTRHIRQFELPSVAGTTAHKPQKSGSLLASIPFFGSFTRQNSLEADLEGESESEGVAGGLWMLHASIVFVVPPQGVR